MPVCHALSWPPVEVQSKKYSTPLVSVAVVATIAIEVEPVAYGAVAHVIGLGEGGVVSGAVVVAHCVVDQLVVLWLGLKSRACTL